MKVLFSGVELFTSNWPIWVLLYLLLAAIRIMGREGFELYVKLLEKRRLNPIEMIFRATPQRSHFVAIT